MVPFAEFIKNAGFSSGVTAAILCCFKRQEVKKGDFFTQTGKIASGLAFIESGGFIFVSNLNGDEKVTYAVGPGGLIASLSSYISGNPTRESIKAISDSVIFSIDRADQKKLVKEFAEFQEWYNAALEYQLVCIDDSRLNHVLLSAEERYKIVLKKEPDLLQLIPLKYLASLLGITGRHLSRIRAKKN